MTRTFPILISATLLLGATDVAGADRVKAGQWETTITVASSKPMGTKYCLTAADAKAMNGDVATLREYVKKTTAEQSGGRCTVKDVKLSGNQTTVTIVCGRTEVTNTTKYFGDRFESSDSNNTKVVGKRLGACP
jgi:hypothetical protein